MKKFTSLLFCAVATACATQGPPPPTVNNSKPVILDRSLLESCQKPTELSSREEPIVVAWISDLLVKFKSCYEKNEAHIEVLKKNFSDKIEVSK